jgi:peptidoglycan/xylan/chitin deacetylase (PgdA/CDA1 family)/predicted ATP-grasp superfamily ATP-dependent carboligase
MRHRHTALVLDGDSGQALAVVRSLGRAGWRILAPAGTRAGASRFAERVVALADTTDHERLAADLARTLDAERVDLLVPCSDASAAILWERHELRRDARVLGGDRSSFVLSVDKASTLAAADSAGFPTPRWLAPASIDEAVRFAQSLSLPCVVKPRRSFCERHGRLVQRRHVVVATTTDLVAALSGLAEADGTLPVVQEHVPGRALAVAAVVRDGRVLAAIARETLSFWPLAGGTSVWRRTIPPTDIGVEAACRLLVDIGYSGLAEVEYQVDADETPRLMEIGARPFAWLPLVAAAGVDLPLVAARSALDDDVPEVPSYRVGVEMRWPGGELLRLAAALGPRRELPVGFSRRCVARCAWPPWRPGMRYDGLDVRDLVPLLPRVFRTSVIRSRSGRPPETPRSSSERQLPPAPRIVYPLKAGLTHTRSAAWLARRRPDTPSQGLRILFYHRVADDGDVLAVPVRRFREQLGVLAAGGHRVLDVVSAFDLLSRGELPPRTIALSFDDGFRDVAEAALPVLQQHGFGATVFVPTAVIDGTTVFGWYGRQPPLLSWDEVTELDRASPLRFEAHSLHHPNLTALDDAQAREEIAGSRLALETRLGRRVDAFCYPGGVFGQRERRFVAEAGYRLAASCEPGVNDGETDRFALRRIQIDSRDRLIDFRAKLSGGHDSPLPFRSLYRRRRYGGGSPRLASSSR